MDSVAVHRIVEQQAATRGDLPAIVCGADVATYRDLNFRANAIARHLIAAGFCRGGHALIDVTPGIELAAVLLAVLKAGGAYTWLGSSARAPWRAAVAVSFDVGRAPQRNVNREPQGGPGDDACASHRPIDLTVVLGQPLRPGPNLPILTRPTDPACVLAVDGGAPSLVVPHATIAALRRSSLPSRLHIWEGDPSTFDLWTGLMAGATLSVDRVPAERNAA
jgi:hypothetical protein